MKSLDPRVGRLPESTRGPEKATLDQFGTYEVFVQPKEGKLFQHEGIVHAPNLEMAFILAKEAFTRRFLCVSIFVVDTRSVFVSATTEGNENAYDLIQQPETKGGGKLSYEVFHLAKRGKQHVHAGTVEATSPEEAFWNAKQKFNDKTVYNIWMVQSQHIRFTQPEEKDLWLTLPDKKFRDAADYKGGDKLKEFLELRKIEELKY